MTATNIAALGRKLNQANDSFGAKITDAVGTMWCAYLFAALAIVGFPFSNHAAVALVQWFAQTFLQLVLLSIIMVGQRVQAQRSAEHSQTLAEIHKRVHENGTAS